MTSSLYAVTRARAAWRHPEAPGKLSLRRREERYFCKHCGITVFGRDDVPQLGGAYAPVNLDTLDDVDPFVVPQQHFDGRHDNWMAGTRPQPWPIFE